MGKFRAGVSGNPKGRPAGLPDRRREFRDLITKAVPELIERALDLARGGDSAALRLLLDRALPPLKAQAEACPFEFPPDGSLTKVGGLILESIAVGGTPPDTGKAMLEALAAQAKLVEVDELVRRIEMLESSLEMRNAK